MRHSSKTQKMEQQGIFFGISTAIMTMLPFQLGLVLSGNNDKREIVSSIVAMSIADSMADAYGIYFSDIATDTNKRQAIIAAGTTFLSKLIIQLSFLVPFFFFSGVLKPTIINSIWGTFVLLLTAYQAASLRNFPKLSYTLQTALFTGVGVGISFGVTRWLSRFF